jgi:hypothetical protein
MPNGNKIDQMTINILHCKTLQNLPKLGFLVRKYTIWQPCLGYILGDFLQTHLVTLLVNEKFPKILICLGEFRVSIRERNNFVM